MRQLKFKTNITCSGCEAKVTPVLNSTFGEGNWKVDVNTPEKILVVTKEDVQPEEVKKALRKVGFQAEELA